MQQLKTTFEHYYPEGSLGGECASFAERLEQFGPVGNTLASKTDYVTNHGILRPALGGHYEIGDVVITNESSYYGHVFVVNDIVGNQLQATESNYKLDSKVHHTRIVPVSTKIIGVLRNCPLKVAIVPEPTQPTSKTFMELTVADNVHWTTLQSQLDLLKKWFIHYSGGRIEPVFNIASTNFPLVPFSSFETGLAPDVNWYRDKVTPLAKGQGTIMLLPYPQWQSSNTGYTWGWMTWGDPNKPVRISTTGAENEIIPANTPDGFDTAPVFVHRAFHEICHMIFFLTGQPDRTHELLLIREDRKADLLNYMDYDKLQKSLVNIKW